MVLPTTASILGGLQKKPIPDQQKSVAQPQLTGLPTTQQIVGGLQKGSTFDFSKTPSRISQPIDFSKVQTKRPEQELSTLSKAVAEKGRLPMTRQVAPFFIELAQGMARDIGALVRGGETVTPKTEAQRAVFGDRSFNLETVGREYADIVGKGEDVGKRTAMTIGVFAGLLSIPASIGKAAIRGSAQVLSKLNDTKLILNEFKRIGLKGTDEELGALAKAFKVENDPQVIETALSAFQKTTAPTARVTETVRATDQAAARTSAGISDSGISRISQSVLPKTELSGTLEKVRETLSNFSKRSLSETVESLKISPSSIPKVTLSDLTDIQKVYRGIEQKANELGEIMRKYADDFTMGIKEPSRAIEKIGIKRYEKPYKADDLEDLVRSRVVVGSENEAHALANNISEKTVVNDFFQTPNVWGYKGVNLNIKLPSGVGELQIHTPTSLKVQKAIRPIYLKWRNTPYEEIPPSVFEESKRIANDVYQRESRGSTIKKLTEALKKAKPARQQQEKLFREERERRAGRVAAVAKKVSGEKGFFAQLKQLKGELPKKDFEAIRKDFGQDEIDTLFDAVEHTNALTIFEKITAKVGLQKLFEGTVPTKGEIALLREVFGDEFVKALPDTRSWAGKVGDFIGKALNLPRAIMATLDLSAPLRQGIFMVGRPRQFLPAFKDMFKFAASEKSYEGLMKSIKARPSYRKMREARIAFTDMGEDLMSREEQFMSSWAEKIPGFGALARASNRAYTGFLNKLRADVFDDLIRKADATGIDTDSKEFLEGMGRFINAATGRGNLPSLLERGAPILNATFFSPRLMASRINLLNPLFYTNLDPFVRKEALKSLISFGGIAGTVAGISALAGADVGTDPRNADFMKIKVGDTRYDILGGFQQYVRMAAQLITGEIVSSTTGRTMTVGEGYKPLSRLEIAQRFFENKTAPVPSFIIQWLKGTTATGEDFDLPTEVINRFIPMVTQDLYDLAQEEGIENIWQGAPAIFGVGVQSYGKQELVTGKTKIGEETAQIRPVQELAERVREAVLGEIPLGTTKSFSAQAYFDQLKKMPKEEAAEVLELMNEENPDLIKKIAEVAREESLGVTPHDRDLKAKGVQDGSRATAIVKDLKKLKTKEEQANLLADYKKKGILTPDVARQVVFILKGGE